VNLPSATSTALRRAFRHKSIALCTSAAGHKTLAINAYGHMSSAAISQQDTYDTRQGSLKRRLGEVPALAVRTQKRKQLTKCAECKIQSLCGMCPANGELESGNKETPVPFLCEARRTCAHMSLGLGSFRPMGIANLRGPAWNTTGCTMPAGRIRSPRNQRGRDGLSRWSPFLGSEPESTARSVCGGCGSAGH